MLDNYSNRSYLLIQKISSEELPLWPLGQLSKKRCLIRREMRRWNSTTHITARKMENVNVSPFLSWGVFQYLSVDYRLSAHRLGLKHHLVLHTLCQVRPITLSHSRAVIYDLFVLSTFYPVPPDMFPSPSTVDIFPIPTTVLFFVIKSATDLTATGLVPFINCPHLCRCWNRPYVIYGLASAYPSPIIFKFLLFTWWSLPTVYWLRTSEVHIAPHIRIEILIFYPILSFVTAAHTQFGIPRRTVESW